MLALETIVAIGAGLYLAALLAPRVRIPLPLVQVALGVLLGFIPALRDVELPSEAVLLLFLPALLFFESLTISRQLIRRFIRVVLLNGTVLVVVTAFTAAWAATFFGVPWAIALVLGAALAPTDATAVGSLARGLPLRTRTVLRAESLINDGTALVVYAIAVGAAVGTLDPTPLAVTGDFVMSYLGGVVIGVAVGYLGVLMLKITSVPLQANVGLAVTPFIAFLAAELAHASGVLAVVVCGLLISQRASRVAQTEAREQGRAFWQIATYMLNGALFVLIGLEMQVLVRELGAAELWRGLAMGVTIWVVLIATRGAFAFVSTVLIRTLDRRPYQRTLRSSPRGITVSVFAGYRGAVSLAAALAVPMVIADGEAFPDRELIIFTTAVVILLTLLVQGPLLAPLIRWARFPADDAEHTEETTARREATQAAIDAMPGLAADLGIDEEIRDKAIGMARQHLEILERKEAEGPDGETAARKAQLMRLQLAALRVKRDTLLRLRDERQIGDMAVNAIQSQLDLEELRLTGRSIEE